MNIATKILLSLILLGIIDVLIPLPIVGFILIYVILQKPPWFREMVRAIYREGDG
jgi:hypothetical protein